VHKSKIKQISLAVCLAFMPLSGFAAGLGKLNVNSGLGEPLKAEVELLSVTPEELSTLAASVASEEAYAAQGITRLGVHGNIKVNLSKSADGSPILVLQSSLPINDPYLDMLIQVDWASGRLLREYTVLLDPPGYKESINQTSQSIVSSPSTTVKSVDSGPTATTYGPDSADKSVNKKFKKTKKINNEQNVATDSGQLMTVRGDTLSSIAKELQIEGVNLDQMLVGLYENNKEAFSNGNMNRLKVGQIIKAPSKEALTAVDPQQAKQAIKAHSANWNEYRNTLAGTVAAAPVAVESEQKQTASGKIATAEDKATPPKVGSQDVVKLSAGAKDAVAGSSGAKDFDAKVLALQEEATAREKSLKEALDRTAALEKQIEDMQKLLALKNQTMTDLQKNAADQAVPAEAKPAETSAVPVQPAQEVKPVEPVKKAPKVAVAPVEATPAEESSFIEGLLGDSNLPLLGGVAGIGLLGAGWMYLRNKRRKDLDSFERGILTSGGLRANTVFGNTTGNASTSDTSFLTDFAQSADGSMIDTNDVDPIAEAEVYMAYGRDAQAEEILKDAIVKEPKRYELHLKLLEMYAARKDTSAFETIAGELYTTLGADDPIWAKVVELGATVEPDNPLYDTSKLTTEAAVTEKLDASDFADVAVAADEGLDFSLGDESVSDSQPAQLDTDDAGSAVMQSFAGTDNVEQALTFDLGTVDEEQGQTDVSALNAEFTNVENEQSAVEEAVLDQVNTLDSNMSLSTGSAAQADNSMDFELSEFATELQSSPAQTEALPVIEVVSSAEENQADALDLSIPVAATEEESAKETDFNLEFNLPSAEVTSASEETAEIALNSNALDGISFDLGAPEALEAPEISAPAIEKAEEISFGAPAVAETELESEASGANEFDFSAISLDLGDATQAVEDQVADEMTVELSAPVVSENQDVDIKLDLVAAYIDMDDKEGARELLDEVIKEGGPQQRQRAELLLASLA